MARRRAWWVAGLVAGGMTAIGGAWTNPTLALEPGGDIKRAEPVVVTATRVEEPLEQIGASVTVIPEEAIRVQGYRTVEEALRDVPGLNVTRSGSPGKITTVQIRGANSTQIQVLIDGVRVNSTTTGDFDFADLTVDQIERIEVVRGPQSTIYGADAIGGVINVITKRGQGAPTGYVDFEGGNYATLLGRVGTSGQVGPGSFTLGGSAYTFGGQFPNDETSLTSANGRLAYALPNRGELSLVGRLSDAHTGIPFKTVFPDFDPNREQTDRFWLLSFEWRQPWTAWYEHALRVSATQDTLTFRDPADPGTTEPSFRSDIVTARREVDWLNIFRPVPWNTLTVGFEYQNEVGDNQGTFDRSTNTGSSFLQDELKLFDRLFLTGGVRYDDNSVYGADTTGRVAVSFVVRETDTRLKGSWGQGFRAPTFNELFFPAFPPCPPFGNPNLKPEKSESWDGGLEQGLWDGRVKLGGTYFRNDFTNLIQTTLIDPTNFCFQAQNVGRARSQGVEVEASVMPADGLSVGLAYTYTDSQDLGAHTPLRRTPKNRLAVTAAWEPWPGLTLSTEFQLVSSQFEGPGLPRTPGYHVVNAAAQYRLRWRWGPLSRITLHVRVTNLFDATYQEVAGFPALGTQVLGGIRASFE